MSHNQVSEYNRIDARFSHLRDGSTHIYSPIKGYEKKSLVSLEKAIEPIAYLFFSIHQYVRISKEKCRNPPDGLTQDESASVYLYTMEFHSGPSLYRLLNDVLRSEEHENVTQWFSYLKLFLTALNKLPSQQCKVWRGVHNINLNYQYTPGKQIVWWAVSSCTLSLDVLKNGHFVNKDGLQNVFSIDCKNGKIIAAHSAYKNKEQEVILMPGSYFQIKDNLNQSSDIHTIEMEEIPPFSPLALPPDYPIQSVTITKISENNKQPNKSSAVTNKMKNTNVVGTTPQSKTRPNSKHGPTSATKQNLQKLEEEKNSTDMKVVVTIAFALLTLIPIATLVLGQIYKNECPIQTWIPQWMIIFGAVGIATFGLLFFLGLISIMCYSLKTIHKIEYIFAGVLLCLLICFYLAWLITGSLWVFPITTNVQYNESDSENYCRELLYKFLFTLLIFQYVLILLIICITICILVYKLCRST